MTDTAFPLRMNRKKAAEYLGIPESTLAVDVCRKRLCVPHIKAGRSTIYDRNDLDKWLAAHRVEG